MLTEWFPSRSTTFPTGPTLKHSDASLESTVKSETSTFQKTDETESLVDLLLFDIWTSGTPKMRLTDLTEWTSMDVSCASITLVTNVPHWTDEANVEAIVAEADGDTRVPVPAVATVDDDDALDPDRARTNGAARAAEAAAATTADRARVAMNVATNPVLDRATKIHVLDLARDDRDTL